MIQVHYGIAVCTVCLGPNTQPFYVCSSQHCFAQGTQSLLSGVQSQKSQPSKTLWECLGFGCYCGGSMRCILNIKDN